MTIIPHLGAECCSPLDIQAMSTALKTSARLSTWPDEAKSDRELLPKKIIAPWPPGRVQCRASA